MIQNPEYFARGSRCNRRIAGNSNPRYPENVSVGNQTNSQTGRRTEIENASQPLIFMSLQANILWHSRDTRVRQRSFYMSSVHET
jgi:hypothetical protein